MSNVNNTLITAVLRAEDEFCRAVAARDRHLTPGVAKWQATLVSLLSPAAQNPEFQNLLSKRLEHLEAKHKEEIAKWEEVDSAQSHEDSALSRARWAMHNARQALESACARNIDLRRKAWAMGLMK